MADISHQQRYHIIDFYHKQCHYKENKYSEQTILSKIDTPYVFVLVVHCIGS